MVTTAFSIEDELQKLLDQQFGEDQGVVGLLPSNVSPFFRMDATSGVVPQQFLSTGNFENAPMRDMATGIVPLLKDNIPTIQNLGIPFEQIQGILKSSSPQDDLEESAIPEFAEGQLKQSPTGIARLFELLGNIPTPFNLVRRGLESLSGLNQRIQQSDFGQSRNLMDYLDIKKYGSYQDRENARARTMAQARGIQKKIDRGDFGGPSASIDRGRTSQAREAAIRSRDLTGGPGKDYGPFSKR